MNILLIGDPLSGKTRLVLSFIKQQLEDQLIIGSLIETYVYKTLIEDQRIELVFIEVNARGRFHTARKLAYRISNKVILSFDLTRRTSFDNVTKWIAELNANIEDLVWVLVGNKSDLEDMRDVSIEEGKAIADELGAIGYFETSALFDIKVENVFYTFANAILSQSN